MSEWDEMARALNAITKNDYSYRLGLERAAALIYAYAKAKPGQMVRFDTREDRLVLDACEHLARSRAAPAASKKSGWMFWRLR